MASKPNIEKLIGLIETLSENVKKLENKEERLEGIITSG